MPEADTGVPTAKRTSVAAIVTYWLLLNWTLLGTAVVYLIVVNATITAVMLGVLGGIIGTQSTLTIGAVGFWIGSSLGAKMAGDQIAATQKDGQAALAQLAGADGRQPRNLAGTQATVTVSADQVDVTAGETLIDPLTGERAEPKA